MAELNIETVIKSGVEKALNKPIMDGKSITEWAAIGMKAPRWISVEDRLPDKNVPVLVYEKHGYVYVDRLEAECAWQIAITPSIVITHWMPIPEPPKGAE